MDRESVERESVEISHGEEGVCGGLIVWRGRLWRSDSVERECGGPTGWRGIVWKSDRGERESVKI